MGHNGTLDMSSVIDNSTYKTNPGKSMTHIINGMAGNIESHSTINTTEILNITAVLDQEHYGFGKLNILNATALTWEVVRGDGVASGEMLTLLKS